LGVRSRRIETAISTDVSTLVIDGELVLEGMRRASMGRNTVFAILRGRGLQQLGQVSRLYMEPSGSFSLIKAAPARPGLAMIPRFDTELLTEARVEGHFACESCGHTVASAAPPEDQCDICHQNCWLPAVLKLER
ncbi:MAG: YetF domain-containing protein, partial [Janthinobacterium lividum]